MSPQQCLMNVRRQMMGPNACGNTFVFKSMGVPGAMGVGPGQAPMGMGNCACLRQGMRCELDERLGSTVYQVGGGMGGMTGGYYPQGSQGYYPGYHGRLSSPNFGYGTYGVGMQTHGMPPQMNMGMMGGYRTGMSMGMMPMGGMQPGMMRPGMTSGYGMMQTGMTGMRPFLSKPHAETSNPVKSESRHLFGWIALTILLLIIISSVAYGAFVFNPKRRALTNGELADRFMT